MQSDLSLRHEPVTDLFPALRAAPEGVAEPLSSSQVAFFRENGYLSGVRILDEAQLAALRDEVERAHDLPDEALALLYEHHRNESVDPARRLFHCLGHWRVLPGLHDLLWHHALVRPAAQLLEGAVRLWHDQLFDKPAGEGGAVAWHQDYAYWTRTRPLSHLTAWIALDDADRDNGCVHYVPGSHRWALLPKPALAGDMEAIRQLLTEEQRAAFRPAPSEVRAGYASFHHALTLHGSYENRSARRRRGAVVNFVRDGVVSASDEPLLAGVPPIPAGQPLGGRFFPLLYARAVPSD